LEDAKEEASQGEISRCARNGSLQAGRRAHETAMAGVRAPAQPRKVAARANLAKARAVQVSRGYVMTEARLAANRENLKKARAARGRRAQHWHHGLACASVLASLAGAGERLSEFLRHMKEIRDAFEPRDAWEQMIVVGIGEAMWRRFRALRLAARWHTRQLVGLLAGMAWRGRKEMLPEAGESPVQNVRRRALRARRIATGLLVRLAEIQKVFTALKRVNRRLLLLTAALMQERMGEAVVTVPYAGPARVAAVACLPAEEMGNAFARRENGPCESKTQRRNLPDEDEPGPAGDGRALLVTEWEALLAAAFGPGEGQEALARLADVLWAQVDQLAKEAREEARLLRAALREARQLAEPERLPGLALAIEEATLGDSGMIVAVEYLRRQAEALLDQALVAKHGARSGFGWMKRVLARYDRWRRRKEGWPEVEFDGEWEGL
jgi:hypothetical protein